LNDYHGPPQQQNDLLFWATNYLLAADLVEAGKDTRGVYASSANFSPDSAGRYR
jgi:hypothetical protein